MWRTGLHQARTSSPDFLPRRVSLERGARVVENDRNEVRQAIGLAAPGVRWTRWKLGPRGLRAHGFALAHPGGTA
jgi:hypothetical protein